MGALYEGRRRTSYKRDKNSFGNYLAGKVGRPTAAAVRRSEWLFAEKHGNTGNGRKVDRGGPKSGGGVLLTAVAV